VKHIAAAALGIALTIGFAAPAAAQTERFPDCPLTVTFGSYAMGIDQGALKSVDRLLARDRGVRKVDRQRWGREGEITLCARTRTKADAKRLFTRVKRLFPAKPRGPLTVETASGLSFHAPREH
jgi:hypothetical protein